MTTQRRRYSGPRSAWVPGFLAGFRETGNVRDACVLAGIGRTTVYDRLKTDRAFAADFETARDDAVDVLSAEARRRAMSTSDTLLIYLLKVHGGPEYRNDQRRQQEQTFDERQVRAMAQVLADKYGVSVDEIQAEAEMIAREAWSVNSR